MTTHRFDPDGLPREELIAVFGEARLVKTLDGQIAIRGGSDTDRAEAQRWADRFVLPTGENGKEQRRQRNAE